MPGFFSKALFQKGEFKLAGGRASNFKIDCDALTDDDLQCLAFLLHDQGLCPFGAVFGVPTGGERLARAMEQYVTPGAELVLIVDDVWTTGGSMRKLIAEKGLVEGGLAHWGAVIFARGPAPYWVSSVFQMTAPR